MLKLELGISVPSAAKNRSRRHGNLEYHRHRRLLRAYPERPSRAATQSDELTPPHVAYKTGSALVEHKICGSFPSPNIRALMRTRP